MTFEGDIDKGAEVFGSDGHRIGTVGQVFVLEGTEEPTWIAVRTGLFGMQESFVPVAGATRRGDEVIVAYEKGFVKDAPRIADADDLTVDQEAELYRYYGVEPPMRSAGSGDASDAGRPGAADASETHGGDHRDEHRVDDLRAHERGGLGDRDGDDRGAHERGAATAGAAGAAAGPRLRRRIVTEMQTIQVPVQREEIVVEGGGIAPDDERDARG